MAEQGPLSNQRVGGKYLLGDLLGEGGFGDVYKAQHTQLNRLQAIKVLQTHLFRDPAFRARFLREAQLLASLDHPHIVPLHDFGIDEKYAYIVMPFVTGGTLQSRLKGLTLQDVTQSLTHLCAALDHAHQQGIAHLDLKPQNVLVHQDGRLLLSDFGLAHLLLPGEEQLKGGRSLRFGSPHYMAPEHIQGQPERRSDLYSLGVMLYQMLIGRLPFDGPTPEVVAMKHLTERPPSLRAAHPEFSVKLEQVVEKALAKGPDERYQTADELLHAFHEAVGHQKGSLTIEHWLATTDSSVRVGLFSPVPLTTVHHSPILAYGRVEGLPPGDQYQIGGYVITDIEYEQGKAPIKKDGSWKIDAIFLGGQMHRVFFRIFDKRGKMIAESKEMKLFKS